ncbi:SMI1/KNR4 family protein [Paenibacillus sp. PAMC21692]|uniref:SMI1/KNR4 family protein n=1 Tax=Paenibacillus sp. PAMC21692 TaxID=2762320 RepID=UPI00164D2F68|nr:SMI1/KNR4 family protein [Paenibacillus sp. PAMC21692]
MSCFSDMNLADFWKESEYARNKYVEDFPSEELINSIEEELGYKLPTAFIALMKQQNGGIPQYTCFPTNSPTSWAEDHIQITGIMGIGRNRTCSLCGELGSQFMIDEWEYPQIGVVICNCPSAGHDLIMLDYRKCGNDGEPEVVHVDLEADYQITLLAKDFESFIKGLIHRSTFD